MYFILFLEVMLATGLQSLPFSGARERGTKTLLTFCGTDPPGLTVSAILFRIGACPKCATVRVIGEAKQPIPLATLEHPNPVGA
jgi:hypothetical protein